MPTDIDRQFPTRVRPSHTATPKVRQLSRFEIWSWSPIISFQIGLTAGYIALIYFGVSALISTPPSIDVTTPDWYGGYWALALTIGAIAASFGSVSRSKWFQRIETAASAVLTLTVGSYAAIVLFIAYGLGDPDKIAAGAGFTALAIPIAVRSMWLFSQLLRK